MIQDILLGIIGILGLIGIGYFLRWLTTSKTFEHCSPPDIPKVQPIPAVRKQRTFETQYGKDLLNLAEKIYLKDLIDSYAHPDSKARLAIEKAHELLTEFESHCHEIDAARETKSKQEIRELFKEMSKV